MARVELLAENIGARMKGRGGPEARRAFMHRPEMADVIGRFNDVVALSSLEPRLHEVVRYRIAHINGCTRCKAYRSPEGIAAGVSEVLLDDVVSWRTSSRFTELERLCLDYAERFCTEPTSITEMNTEALRRHLGDGGLVDLTVCVAKYLAIGRLISVLDLDQTCEIGSPVLVHQG
jgi:alkylhydroperoxidase family enzyme